MGKHATGRHRAGLALLCFGTVAIFLASWSWGLGGDDAQPRYPPSAGQLFLPYSSDAFFRSTVEGAPVDDAATADFRSFMRGHPDQRGVDHPVIRGVGGNRWGTVYAEGRASDPLWRLTGEVPAEVAVLGTRGFHAPEWLGDVLTGTSDSPFVVVDRASGWSVWAAKAEPEGDRTIRVQDAGLFEHDSNGLDRRNPRSDSDLNFRSRGAIPDAMVIRRDLLDRGVEQGADLGHVLHLFMVETDSSAGQVHPMVGSESDKFGWGAEGQRIAVDPEVDLDRRSCSAPARVIALTLQRYGAYLGDNSGAETSLKAQQEIEDGDTWDGRLDRDELEGCVSWDDFIVITPGWQ